MVGGSFLITQPKHIPAGVSMLRMACLNFADLVNLAGNVWGKVLPSRAIEDAQHKLFEFGSYL